MIGEPFEEAMLVLAEQIGLDLENEPELVWVAQVLSVTPCSLHPTPCTLLPTPHTLHSTPYTLHLTPY